MCLAVPGLIESIDSQNIAQVSVGGVTLKASLALVPEAKVGDYVLIHVGYAIQVLSPEDARETLELLQEIEKKADLKDTPQ